MGKKRREASEAIEFVCPKCHHTEIKYVPRETDPKCPNCRIQMIIKEILTEGKYS